MSLSSVVVVPRERLTSLTNCLESLFSTINDDVPVIVVEGGSSAQTLSELKALERNASVSTYIVTELGAPQRGTKHRC